ncbi:MAG TPA: NUDIX domain-containing protein [Rhizomicrobium sp.]|jgi:ADP-ribose pyrophosphatase YjhB (NUDIX family)|nr:NUDIX domain-containing protein [Rhizomicrobium sp.]
MSPERIALIAKLTAQALLAPVAFGVCALVERGGKVLLVRHSYVSGWLLPGGGVRRAEPAAQAVLREMREEIGLTRCSSLELFGLYSRRSGWATNVIALYRLREAEFAFVPNMEVREVLFADPLAPPPGTPGSVRRRLAEFAGTAPIDHHW